VVMANHRDEIRSSHADMVGVSVIVRVVTDEQSESLAVVVGQNCKRLRKEIGITQDELARYARDLGLRWTASKVGDFEAGRRAPTFTTVLTVTVALQMALEDVAEKHDQTPKWHVRLADLVGGEGSVALTPTFFAPAGMLCAICRGQRFSLAESISQPAFGGFTSVVRQQKSFRETLDEFRSRGHRAMSAGRQQKSFRETLEAAAQIQDEQGLTEHRLARQLGVSIGYLAVKSFELWHSTFSEERDRLAGPDANQQKKGRISRELRAELERALTDGDD
jgi:transcriptional regulator with XRE-family HTH domain